MKKLRRLAIRAAKFEPEADYATWTVSEIHSDGISVVVKKRGAIKGPIRIPLHSQLFLFNALAFPCIPSKSLKFRLVVFSIPTAPTNHLPDGWALNKNTRGQKGADWADDPVLCFFPAARVTTGRGFQPFNRYS